MTGATRRRQPSDDTGTGSRHLFDEFRHDTAASGGPRRKFLLLVGTALGGTVVAAKGMDGVLTQSETPAETPTGTPTATATPTPTPTETPTETPAEPTGRVTAIAPDAHPNLYFNRGEIETLRQKLIGEGVPAEAASVYRTYIRGTSPRNKSAKMDTAKWSKNYSIGNNAARRNMKASIEYMLEPTTAKAEALRTALMSWTENTKPWTRDGQNAGWIHMALAFMYDLLYNSGVLSTADKAHLDGWFQYVADQMIEVASWWTDLANRTQGRVTANREGSARDDYANWWTIRVSCGCVSALVSHDQSLVDRGFNSGLPATYYSSDLSGYAEEETRDLENLLSGLVFPSGYNWDGYERNYGFDAETETYLEAGEPKRGNGQSYHLFAAYPLVFAAEAAAHNGENAWLYGDEAALRTFKRAADWADHAWYGTDSVAEDWTEAYWHLYRRYPNDPDIRAMVAKVDPTKTFGRLSDKTSWIWGALGTLASDDDCADTTS